MFWQPNNDYDLAYLRFRHLDPIKSRLWLIRPTGFNELWLGWTAKVESQPKVIIFNRWFPFVYSRLDALNVSQKLYLPKTVNYGGPHVASKHKMFVYLPYQFSTMKVFENSNAGVVTVIPTARLFKHIVLNVYTWDKTKESPFYAYSDIKYVFNHYPNNWTEFFDVYSQRYTQMFVKFDSFEDLARLIKEEVKIDRQTYWKSQRKIMRDHVAEIERQWDRLFYKIFYDVAVL